MSFPSSQKKIALALVMSFSALALAGFLGISAVPNHYPCITETATGMQCPPPSLPYNTANFHLTILKSFTTAVVALIISKIISQIRIWRLALKSTLNRISISDATGSTSQMNSFFQITTRQSPQIFESRKWHNLVYSLIRPFAKVDLAFAESDTMSD